MTTGKRFNRSKQPLIDVLLAAGIDAREAAKDAYFRNPGADGVWRWHASSLAACPRQQMLMRDGQAPDPTPLNGRATMELGNYFHAVAQEGAAALQHREDDPLPLIGCELGGFHPSLPLAARADVVLGEPDHAFVLEIKAEGHYAFTGRRSDAREAGGVTAARTEHRLQAAAQCVVIEARGDVEHVDDVLITYLDRDKGERDEQPALIDDRWRAAVPKRVEKLEATWAVYQQDGTLPPLLPLNEKGKTPWNCKPTVDGDPFAPGMYCRCRSVCMRLAAEGR